MPLPAGSLVVSFMCPPGERRLPDGTCGIVAGGPPPAPSSGCGTPGITCWYWLVNCTLGQLAVIPNATTDYLNSLIAAGWQYATAGTATAEVATQDQIVSEIPQAVAVWQTKCGLPVINVPPPALVP